MAVGAFHRTSLDPWRDRGRLTMWGVRDEVQLVGVVGRVTGTQLGELDRPALAGVLRRQTVGDDRVDHVERRRVGLEVRPTHGDLAVVLDGDAELGGHLVDGCTPVVGDRCIDHRLDDTASVRGGISGAS